MVEALTYPTQIGIKPNYPSMHRAGVCIPLALIVNNVGLLIVKRQNRTVSTTLLERIYAVSVRSKDRGSKSPILAGDLPFYSCFLSYLPLSRFSLASSHYDGNQRGHTHFSSVHRCSLIISVINESLLGRILRVRINRRFHLTY